MTFGCDNFGKIDVLAIGFPREPKLGIGPTLYPPRPEPKGQGNQACRLTAGERRKSASVGQQ